MSHCLSNKDRIEYYCGNSLRYKICYNKNFTEDTSFLKLFDLENEEENNYNKDLISFIKNNKLQKQFKDGILKYCPRDRVELFTKIPTLVKSREISLDNNCSILAKLNTKRHFSELKTIKKYDIPFSKKKNKLIWRGATTGSGFGNHIPKRSVSRETLIEKYCNEPSMRKGIDVGLTNIVQEAKNRKEYYTKFLKPNMTKKQMLEYKYILSVEGNDVATNTKWIMYSNSVMFMPKPEIESWFLESKLLPYVHYIPIHSDFSNLEAQINWCNSHPKECQKIIKNAKKFINIFLNKRNENKVMKAVLECYLKNVQFV